MKEVFVVIQDDAYGERSWVDGVFATRKLAEDHVSFRKKELIEDELEDSYSFRINSQKMVEESENASQHAS